MHKRIYLSAPDMCGKELEYVHAAFDANWIAPVGPDINAFEEEVCAYTGAKSAAALSSGTAALHLALIVAGVEQGDNVLCSSFTFAGSAFPITYTRANPVFVDSDAKSWNIDPDLLEKAIKDCTTAGKKPKACIVVHLYGMCADMDPIKNICDEYDIALIEDAAESLGAKYKGKQTGTIAPLGIYSFNGNKIITSSGGGMLVASDKKNVEQARFLATQARDGASHYQHSHIGYNYRMSNIAAAIGRGQLTSLDVKIARRCEIFQYYRKELSAVPGIGFIPQLPDTESNWWLTCIVVDSSRTGFTNNDIIDELQKENIESRLLWKPMHLQPVFSECQSYVSGVSESLFRNGLCLPSGSSLSDNDLQRITGIIRGMAG